MLAEWRNEHTDLHRALKAAPCPLCVSEAWFVSWRGPGPICSFQRGEAKKWFLGQRHRHCQGLGLLCVMIPTFTKQLRKNILRVKQRKVQACRCKLGKKREVSAPRGPPGHNGQVTPTPLLEPHWFSKGSHSPFLLVNPSHILTQWLDSRGCADTLACRIRDCSLAIQQWLDSQDGLIVHPWGKQCSLFGRGTHLPALTSPLQARPPARPLRQKWLLVLCYTFCPTFAVTEPKISGWKHGPRVMSILSSCSCG